jgi:hypothetical protein
MPIEVVKGKLHQARSALMEMRDEEQKAYGPCYMDRLSAFLSAGRSVDYTLRTEYRGAYRKWRKRWNGRHKNEDRLLKCMHDIRDNDVHEGASGLHAKSQNVKIGTGGYSNRSGTFQSTGSPTAIMGQDVTGSTSKQTYFLNVCGIERPATQACDEYLTVLENMVARFEADVSRT